ncbi:MAG: TonB-dependent receptor, partial [Bryobacteraceae bacterium]
ATSTYYYFNPAAFAAPAQGTYGNEKRNQFYGPSTRQIDFSVFKNIPITERVKLQIRAEIFNIFNFVNYSGPANNVQGSNLGQVGSTYDVNFGAPGIGPGAPRNVQLSAKVIF